MTLVWSDISFLICKLLIKLMHACFKFHLQIPLSLHLCLTFQDKVCNKLTMMSLFCATYQSEKVEITLVQNKRTNWEMTLTQKEQTPLAIRQIHTHTRSLAGNLVTGMSVKCAKHHL